MVWTGARACVRPLAMRTLILSIVLSSSLVVSACGGKGGDGGGEAVECGAFSLTVDGQPVTGLVHGLAFTHKRNGELTQQVDLFNHDKTTCEQITSKTGRPVQEGEVSVRAFTGGSGLMGDGFGIEAHTQMGLGVKLASPAPQKPGDKVALCVPESNIEPQIGDYKGKKIKVSGKLEGTYCGVMDWDAK